VVLTPIYLLSYLFSLLWVSRLNNSRRAALATSPEDSFPNDKTHHQNSDTGTWHTQDGGGSQGWFVSKKHRMVTGMEMAEAEEVRGVVMGGIVTVVFVAVGAGAYGGWAVLTKW
jgi:hypothetical protein